MGLQDFINERKEKARREQTIKDAIKRNPRFAEYDLRKIELHPVDGDKDRMLLYGCYKGDSFTYNGELHTIEEDDVPRISVEYARDKKQLYAGAPAEGDKVNIEIFELTYTTADYPRTEKGWGIKCTDKTTPMKDIVMPDKLFGIPVRWGKECFRDCYNIASVAHISKGILEYPDNARWLFLHSGLREVPQDLLNAKEPESIIKKACSHANAIHNIPVVRSFVHNGFYEGHLDFYGFEEERKLKGELQGLKEYKEYVISQLVGELPRFKNAEKWTFFYDYNPTTVYRVQDEKGEWYGMNFLTAKPIVSGLCVFDDFNHYMWRYKQERVHGLDANSIKAVPLSEVAEKVAEIYDVQIAEKEALLSETVKERDKYIASEVEKADQAQAGLDFTPRTSDAMISFAEKQEKIEHDEDDSHEDK